MRVFRSLCRVLAVPMALVLILASYPAAPARAALVGTEQALAPHASQPNDTEARRGRIAMFLKREDVRRQIVQMGVDPREADARVGSLSDAEVAKLSSRIDQAPAGTGVVAVFIILGIIFAVLIALDLLGVTHIFKAFR